ncbi:arabinogalactan oligomer/maltooligosaccharide transport system substrate-binding protein [Nocardiopsis mwathae]|uniref:Arabinogalactan oligomer/maltooligosaccharide transport system substrate-binding protein n=1 Tax=Nocardiopsis mwathae TaxID=1472723 RepID=A0A7W9YGE3_9ACTN|nr:extracellular solute-binding protein [Nocardiopsis mwathae]MBB6171597.1 arabinogalactan oligomer/maltooligosaccharide transport system substrate-binding protein [Nocardiopsis mwathae]
MRLAPIAAAALGLALALPACGTGAPAPEATGEITFWDTSDATTEAPAVRRLIDEFNAAHPDYTVHYENVPFADAQDTFKTAAQSGDGAPDVLRADVGWVAELAALGYLAPLDGTPALEDPDDFLPTPYSSTRYEGATYAVPQVTDALGLLYNTELLAEAGHTEPPATMADLKRAALDVGERTDADGLYLNAADGFFLLPHYYAHGGDLLDTEAQRITVNDGAGVAALEEVLDLIESGAAARPALTDTYATMQTAFKEGDVAMIFNGPWAMGDLRAGSAFAEDPANLGVAPVPAGPGGQGSPTGGHDYAVYAGSGEAEAAHAFIRFMASADTQAALSEELGLLPTRASVYEREEVASHPTVRDFAPVVETARPGVWIPEGGTLFEPFTKQLPAAVSGSATAQEALDGVAADYRAALGWD